LQRLSFRELCDAIERFAGSGTFITFHSVGDRDAIGSALALSSYLKGSTVATPDFLTGNTRRLLDEVGYADKVPSVFPEGAEKAIVLDANNTEALGRFGRRIESFAGEVLFIDHHRLTERKDKEWMIFDDESFNSASSIVYEILKDRGAGMDRTSALLLLNGIIADSAEFQNASAGTFMQVSELLRMTGQEYSSIAMRLHESISPEGRLLAIREIAGASSSIEGRYLIMYGKAAMHANIAADAAIRAGADAAVFWSAKDGEASVSARLRSPLDSVLSVHLGKIMGRHARIIKGTGGGHPCAAGAYGPGAEEIDEMVNACLDDIRRGIAEEGRRRGGQGRKA
jgi:nanoRNase/pAp phosphatase (c-di-AMP/oligoRNAs hydrolase)